MFLAFLLLRPAYVAIIITYTNVYCILLCLRLETLGPEAFTAIGRTRHKCYGGAVRGILILRARKHFYTFLYLTFPAVV
jgi:hypothetical protein